LPTSREGGKVTRVLIVEDEPAISEAIRYLMEAEGFHCLTARDGASAIEQFRQARPDLVLLDVMLPGASGIEVLREFAAPPPRR
jgi:DNA-binding response OmpR family regulator